MKCYRIATDDLSTGAKIPLKCLGDSGEVFYEMALEMIREIEKNNALGKRTVFIVPVGPTGQYPIFIRLVNERQLSLKSCWFVNMDEYMVSEDTLISEKDPLSFVGFMQEQVYSRIDAHLLMPPEQRLFPDPAKPQAIDQTIESLGGVDIAFGGIGINGHLAFNEPQPELSPDAFAQLPTRVLTISPETLTANAIGSLGGALDAMPRYCVTIGIKQILSAKKVRLAVFRDWHRAVLRRAAHGEVSSAFPVSLLQNHPDACIWANENAAKLPY